MFATANPSTGGFDVRGLKARPLLRIRYGMFDVDTDGIDVIGNSQVDGESS
jgi:hypothetical protein